MSDKKWRLCGSCKKQIDLGSTYYDCEISSCRKSAYCSMPCFDDHSSIFRHKDAWAQEKKAPLVAEIETQTPKRIDSARLVSAEAKSDLPHDVLVVASKLKDYIRAKSGMNTSANVLDRLSDMIRIHCNKAMERAASDNRKTVMDRDFYL
jgi:hypothetical protein